MFERTVSETVVSEAVFSCKNFLKEVQAMNEENEFYKVFTKVEKLEKSFKKELDTIKRMLANEEYDTAYPYSLVAEEIAEKIVLLTRALPCYTGRPVARVDVEKIIKKNVPVEIGYTKQGWFSIRIPALLPRKEHGGLNYIRGFLYPAMNRYFKDKPRKRFTDCVLIYRHVYNTNRPERLRRDHDNIEINIVSDIVALYVMPDDGPSISDQHYCSAEGTADRTEVYVPKSEFVDWLTLEESMPDEGVELGDFRP